MKKNGIYEVESMIFIMSIFPVEISGIIWIVVSKGLILTEFNLKQQPNPKSQRKKQTGYGQFF